MVSPAAAVTNVGSKTSFGGYINHEEIAFMIRVTHTTVSANLDKEIGGLDSGSGKKSSDSDGKTHFDNYWWFN